MGPPARARGAGTPRPRPPPPLHHRPHRGGGSMTTADYATVRDWNTHENHEGATQ